MQRYNPKEIEPKWQKKWEAEGIHKASEDPAKPKRYVLEYFPYPSGAAMHVGHVRNYTIGDVVSRHMRMQGNNVLHPMGWDGFGLPAENYAIKTGISPRQAVDENTAKFKRQLMQMGFGYDWSREIDSTDPNYYKWTQWFFKLLFERGLAYQQESLQWWCPVDKTVLANEQVEAGKCWRCGSDVEKKSLKQWFFKITDYADRLLDGLEDLDWSEGIKAMQRNWIGKSKGAEVDFEVEQDLKGQDFVFIHCYNGDNQSDFAPWLKKELEKRGASVYSPNLPNADKPDVEEQVEFLLKSYEFNEKTILVTHSLGGVVAMKLLPKLKQPIQKLLMVAPPLKPELLDGKKRPALEAASNWEFDFNSVSSMARKIIVLCDTTDHLVPVDHPKEIAQKLGAECISHVAAEPHFNAVNEPSVLQHLIPKITVFTTRPDTLFGTTFMVLAPEHPLVAQITTAEQKQHVNSYVKNAEQKSDIERQETEREKTGVFTGAHAINPVNNEKVPIWVADYVLMGYGTGAIMAVPAHDERDYEFAKKFDLPIKQVIAWSEEDSFNPPKPGLEMVERQMVIVHLRDKSTGKFALLNWHESLEGITTAIMGGIEKGQTPEEAALMEISEEAAISNAKIINKTQWISVSRYCASHKNQNRKAVAYGLLAEVDSLDNQGDIPDNEKKLHTLIWVDKEKVAETLTPDHQKFVWEQLWDEQVYTGEGEMINSGEYDGMISSEAREKIVADLAKKKASEEKVNYKIRDWLISRQRYWGAPIPIVHCPKDGAVAVPDDQLPVVLPEIKSYEPRGDGRSPLANVPEFVNTTCPKCGGKAERETDTMDGFACSSWYFLRFADPHNKKEAFAKDKAKFWLPVDDYIGGAEHAVMHLLYARFWTKVMFDEGLIDFEEPFRTLRNQGMILAPDGNKMSKSKGNTIEPDGLIEQGYGADAIRIMELFIGPWNQSANWSVEGIGGAYRFLQRVWTLTHEQKASSGSKVSNSDELLKLTHKAIATVSNDLHELGFNTAIASLMELTNSLYKIKAEHGFADNNWQFALDTLVQLLAPFAPHIAEELWQELGHKDSVHISDWPVHDKKYLLSKTISIVVQVNGKLRANVSVATDSDEATVVIAAKADQKVAAYLAHKQIKKTIYIPGRIVNFVV